MGRKIFELWDIEFEEDQVESEVDDWKVFESECGEFLESGIDCAVFVFDEEVCACGINRSGEFEKDWVLFEIAIDVFQ